MLKEFKTFIMRGNIIDLAVAVVIGAAFTAIVNSLVADIITPLILNPVMNLLDVKDLENVMWHNVKYGKFLAAVINFIIIGFVLFMLVKTMNKIQEKADAKLKAEKKEADETPAEPVLSSEEKLLTEIRDLLKKQG
ncbi:MAG: large conductance mechanosensitive channel protein MscL [Crocinitomicaceae bacterium]|nr:MAG: large conductance mechanosensitive channel protein MscL [Crocinitomicaceae bacterium]